MRIGCSTIPLAPLSGEAALRTLADLGFEVVDLAAVSTLFDHIQTIDPPRDQPDRFAKLVSELGLEVNGVPTVVWIPDALDDLAELRRRSVVAADVAAAVEARCWIVDAGIHPEGQDRSAVLDRFKRTVAMQHELAVARGLRLVVEAPHGGTLADQFSGIADVVDAALDVGADVGLDFDSRPVHNCGAPYAQVISQYSDRIAHVAVADTRGRGKGHASIGDGHIDFHSFLGELKAAGWDGDLMLELEPGGSVVNDRIALIQRDRDRLSGILRKLGADGPSGPAE